MVITEMSGITTVYASWYSIYNTLGTQLQLTDFNYGNYWCCYLEGIHIAAFKVHLFSSSVEYCNIPNVNSYKSSCNQCSTIAASTIYYSLINCCGYST